MRVRNLINWEKRTGKKNGKYVDAIQAKVSPSIQERCIQYAFGERACFLILVDNLLPVDPQVKLHYRQAEMRLICSQVRAIL